MPDVRDGLRDGLRAALARAGVDPAAAPADIAIERPQDRSHGDWSSNAALSLTPDAASGIHCHLRATR